jgi:hypothetical protein
VQIPNPSGREALDWQRRPSPQEAPSTPRTQSARQVLVLCEQINPGPVRVAGEQGQGSPSSPPGDGAGTQPVVPSDRTTVQAVPSAQVHVRSAGHG